MGKIVFITGGARSGKSSLAETMAINLEKPIEYIATLNIWDLEMQRRVEIHKDRRDENFHTTEAYKDFEKIFQKIPNGNTILFDCLTNMVTNLLLENDVDWDKVTIQEVEVFEKNIEKEVDILINALQNHHGNSFVVSNELGMGLVPTYPLGRYFRDIAGRMNQKLAQISDEVYLVVSGIPLKIK